MIQVNRIYLIFNRLVTKKFLVDTSALCSSINTKELGCKCMEEQEKNVEKLLRRVYDFVNQGF